MKNESYLSLLAKYGIDGAHPGGLQLTGELLKREAISKNTVLLDVGCGTGQTSAYIARNYQCHVTAVDINMAMLQKAALRMGAENLNVQLMFANTMQLPFVSQVFDIVLAESVTIFTTLWKSLAEYCRVLKLNGTLIDIELTAESPLTAGELLEIRPVLGINDIPTEEEWCKLFLHAGFSKIQGSKGLETPQLNFLSPGQLQDFYPYLSIMSRYRRKLGYRVYRCQI